MHAFEAINDACKWTIRGRQSSQPAYHNARMSTQDCFIHCYTFICYGEQRRGLCQVGNTCTVESLSRAVSQPHALTPRINALLLYTLFIYRYVFCSHCWQNTQCNTTILKIAFSKWATAATIRHPSHGCWQMQSYSIWHKSSTNHRTFLCRHLCFNCLFQTQLD